MHAHVCSFLRVTPFQPHHNPTSCSACSQHLGKQVGAWSTWCHAGHPQVSAGFTDHVPSVSQGWKENHRAPQRPPHSRSTSRVPSSDLVGEARNKPCLPLPRAAGGGVLGPHLSPQVHISRMLQYSGPKPRFPVIEVMPFVPALPEHLE